MKIGINHASFIVILFVQINLGHLVFFITHVGGLAHERADTGARAMVDGPATSTEWVFADNSISDINAGVCCGRWGRAREKRSRGQRSSGTSAIS
jgi:hypothetical protein